MSITLESQSVSADDNARNEFCHRLADAMRTGVFRFQVRFLRHEGVLGEVWLYVHQSHEWVKQHDDDFPPELVPNLWAQMEMIATRKYADSWACLRADHPDRTDFKLMFRRKFVERHLKSNLESFLNGCLFHGHHDSGKDSRRRIRFRG